MKKKTIIFKRISKINENDKMEVLNLLFSKEEEQLWERYVNNENQK